MKKLAVLLLIGALAGCSQIDADTNTPEELTKQPMKPIEIAFAGDTMMDWSVKKAIDEKGVDYPFKAIQKEITAADYAVVNLETAVTKGGDIVSKQFNFRSNPTSLQGLVNTGFDLVSLANNHTMDYGVDGLKDTMKHLQSYGLPQIGAGYNDKEAYASVEKVINGKTIKFLGFSRVLPDVSWFAKENSPGIASAYDEQKVLEVIQKEKPNTDYLFVFIHWGIEKAVQPEPFQQELAQKMIDAGADGIVGSHPHVLQGFDYYKGKPIAYSLGNFLFPDYVSGNAANTGILTLVVEENNIHMRFNPYYIQSNQVIKKDTSYDQQQLSYLQTLSPNTTFKGIDILPSQK